MTVYNKFKPNLIPNSKVKDPINLEEIIGDNVSDYIVSWKKDGCRLEIINGKLLTRALKPVTSNWIIEKYSRLAERCQELGIILEGEIFSPKLRFSEIVRYFKSEDVRSDSSKARLNFLVNKGTLEREWPGRTVEELSTYPKSLKLYLFDILFIDNVNIKYDARMRWLMGSFNSPDGRFYEFRDLVDFGVWKNIWLGREGINTYKDLEAEYDEALASGYEGLVIAHKDRKYKFNRSTAKENTIFKMKEDKLQFDGVVLDIAEGTVAVDWAEKTTNELGRSVTSKLKEDRIPSGIASGIVSEYDGHSITVSLDNFNHDELRELLNNKQDFIGKWFRYTGMAPTKNVPRGAHASRDNMWRDAK